jgi:hypothetical protein
MITRNSNSDPSHKVLHQIIEQFGAASRDLNNWQLTNCRICRSNGWPHEAITFSKVNGRVLSNGTNEVKKWIIRDYFTDNIHEHKQQRGAA